MDSFLLRKILLVVVLQVGTHGSLMTTTCIRLPLRYNTSRIRGKQMALLTIHSTYKCTHAERTTSSTLSISSVQRITEMTPTSVADVPHSSQCTLRKEFRRRKYGSSGPLREPIDHTGQWQVTMSTSFLASAFSPAKRNVIFSSIFISFFIERGSCNCAVIFFSIPRTMHFEQTAATTENPYPSIHFFEPTFLTASMAYSTWKRCPSGEKTVNARS